LARTYSGIGQFGDASRAIAETITTVETTKENCWRSKLHRRRNRLKLPERDVAKPEAHFERELVVAPEQQAKSWELRTATSMTNANDAERTTLPDFGVRHGIVGDRRGK
jgi:hypothetical protein